MVTRHSSRIQLDFRETAQSGSLIANLRFYSSNAFYCTFKQAAINKALDNCSKRTSITSNYDTFSKTTTRM